MTPFVKPTAEARITLNYLPAEVTRCDGPARLPIADMSRDQVETFWRLDRVALVLCKKNLETLVKDRETLADTLRSAGR